MAHSVDPNAHRKNDNPMMGRADPTKPLTTSELRQNELGARFIQNAALLRRNQLVNLQARDRHGVEFRQGSPDAPGLGMLDNERERAKTLANQNNRLQIAPAAINPTRGITDTSKKISKGFAILDNILNSATDSLDNMAVRGEVARLSTLARLEGQVELSENLDKYMDWYKTNGTLTGTQFGGSLRTLRDLQAQIRDEFDVDFLIDQTDGNLISALPPGYQIGADGAIMEYANRNARISVRDNRIDRRDDDFHSDFEMGGLFQVSLEDHNASIAAARAAAQATTDAEDAYWDENNRGDLPWWSKQ